MPIKHVAAAAALALTASLGACASAVGAGDYSVAGVGQVNRVEEAVIRAVRPVRIAGNDDYVGTATGAAVGGIAGSQIGGGDEERAIGAIAGAVVGGIVGGATQRGLSGQQGYEYILQLPSGELRTITQGADVYLPPGSRAMIIYGARARVVPAQ